MWYENKGNIWHNGRYKACTWSIAAFLHEAWTTSSNVRHKASTNMKQYTYFYFKSRLSSKPNPPNPPSNCHWVAKLPTTICVQKPSGIKSWKSKVLGCDENCSTFGSVGRLWEKNMAHNNDRFAIWMARFFQDQVKGASVKLQENIKSPGRDREGSWHRIWIYLLQENHGFKLFIYFPEWLWPKRILKNLRQYSCPTLTCFPGLNTTHLTVKLCFISPQDMICHRSRSICLLQTTLKIEAGQFIHKHSLNAWWHLISSGHFGIPPKNVFFFRRQRILRFPDFFSGSSTASMQSCSTPAVEKPPPIHTDTKVIQGE